MTYSCRVYFAILINVRVHEWRETYHVVSFFMKGEVSGKIARMERWSKNGDEQRIHSIYTGSVVRAGGDHQPLHDGRIYHIIEEKSRRMCVMLNLIDMVGELA